MNQIEELVNKFAWREFQLIAAEIARAASQIYPLLSTGEKIRCLYITVNETLYW